MDSNSQMDLDRSSRPRKQIWVITAIVGVSLVGGFALVACNNATSTTTTTATATATTATTPSPESDVRSFEDIKMLVAVSDGNLVAIDLRSGQTRTIANGSELSGVQGLGVQGRFGGTDLSPDGATVIFTFGAEGPQLASYRVYVVPVDGSTGPIQQLTWKQDSEFVGLTSYSPDGKRVAVARDGFVSIIPLTAESWDPLMSIPVPYPPSPGSIQWSPDGQQVIWLDHWERTSCCTTSTATIRSETNLELTRQGDPIAGSPWFNRNGEPNADQRFNSGLDTDASHSWVVALQTNDDESTQVLRWRSDQSVPSPRELQVPVAIDPYSPVVW